MNDKNLDIINSFNSGLIIFNESYKILFSNTYAKKILPDTTNVLNNFSTNSKALLEESFNETSKNNSYTFKLKIRQYLTT